MKKTSQTIHLIANAHIDPVWLWDWREGLNEGVITMRTILDLMDEDPDLTFIRGESAIYQHIEKFDPATFDRIVAQVKKGRWDVVGGTYIQPDTNLPGTETLLRQFVQGQQYFQSRFGKPVKVAWQADSFGHSAGFPDILSAAGIESFAFSRPNHGILPLNEPAFWWEGESGARILCYRPRTGWYGSDRHGTKEKLDELLESAATSRLENVGCFYGLGNHGGGPSRRQLADIRDWAAAHPEVKVIHSGLHRLFSALRHEIQRKGIDVIPSHRGELNFTLRGCYSSAAKTKFLYRKAENLLLRAEKSDVVLSALTKDSAMDLDEAWKGVLFNSFHDILPGSSIERALDDQNHWLGSVIHSSQHAELKALNQLARCVDTQVSSHPEDHPSAVAALVWNPHPWEFHGEVELEAGLDYRIIHQYKGRAHELPIQVKSPTGKLMGFQEIATEHSSLNDFPWRKRVLIPLTLPAFGWNVLEFGWVEGAKQITLPNPVAAGVDWIDNGFYRVEATVGDAGIRVFHKGNPLFGQLGLSATVFEDPWGSWGGMDEEPESIHLNTIREKWKIQKVIPLENGPQRSSLWIQLAGEKSRIALTFSLSRNREVVDVKARILWDERAARLKLVMPVGDQAEYSVPGGTVQRGPMGEVPGGSWVRVNSSKTSFGFASDGLYNFDTKDGEFCATVVRASHYSTDVQTERDQDVWRPAVDCGELRFQFIMTPGLADLPKLAHELEQPPIVTLVAPQKGILPRIGSAAALSPTGLQLLAIKRPEDGSGVILRIQAPAGNPIQAQLLWLGEKISLGSIRGGEIANWRLTPSKLGWKAVRIDLYEALAKPFLRPSPVQLAWQRTETNVFFHFGLNTFTGREWGDGTESPALFDPTALDCRQWARAAKAGGFQIAILTAKHHDGFCLWPTRTTEHSVKSAPWKNGGGDMVREFVDACRAEGLKVGLYLSPWDRHEPCYGDSPRYNDFYCEQLTELLTGYGELHEVWFDGACAEGPNGRRQEYDWQRIFKLVKDLQPGAVTFGDGGTDVRWCGNERGFSGETCWSTVDPNRIRFPGDSGICEANDAKASESSSPMLNEGEEPLPGKDSVWRPAECDVSIRPGWFYHDSENSAVRTTENLVDLYFHSVGRNSLLLLNLPPTPQGLVHPVDAERVADFRREIDRMFSVDLARNARVVAAGVSAETLVDSSPDTWWESPEASATVEIRLERPVSIGIISLREAVQFGQRVAAWRVEASRTGEDWFPVAAGTTVGLKRLVRVPSFEASAVRLVIERSLGLPVLSGIGLHP